LRGMRSSRFASSRKKHRALFAASLLLAAAPLLADAPGSATPSSRSPAKAFPVAEAKGRKAPAKPAGSSASQDSAEGDSSRNSQEFADAYASARKNTPADLQLTKPDERKADALTAFSEGLIAEDNSETEKMIESYRRALSFDPGYTELAVKVAYELARQNDPSAGIQILKDAVKAAPREPLPYVYLSQLYARNLNKPDLALKYAEQAIALAPDNFGANLALYELLTSVGQIKKAEQVLERASKSDSTDPKFWAQLGDLYAQLYLKEDGSSEPAQLQKMNAIYRKAADLGKDDAQTLAKVGDYFVLSKQVKEAIPLYLAALNLKQNSDDPQLDSVREKLARSYIATGQSDDAIRYLEDILKDSPLRVETYQQLGELYAEKGDIEKAQGDNDKAQKDIDKALANFEHSLLLDASDPRNHLRLADLLLTHKHYERAVDIMQAARKKFPDRAEITYGLAIALSQAKRHNEAMAAFSDTLAEAESGREELLNANFYFTYGAAAEQAGLFDKAADLLKQSIELDPNSAQACNYLGFMWVDRGEHLEEAGDLIKKAIAIDPEKGEYIDSLGWYYFKKGDTERALKELLHAEESIVREFKKDDETVLDHIGDAYAKLGRMADALSCWEKSLGLAENKKVADKIEAAKHKVTSGIPPKQETPAH
jgi:tetratricopeptide (TPR) repeat protein